MGPFKADHPRRQRIIRNELLCDEVFLEENFDRVARYIGMLMLDFIQETKLLQPEPKERLFWDDGGVLLVGPFHKKGREHVQVFQGSLSEFVGSQNQVPIL